MSATSRPEHLPWRRRLIASCLAVLAFAAILYGCFVVPVPTANLIPNPGFEQKSAIGLADWGFYHNSGAGSLGVSIAPHPVYAGTYSAILNVTTPGDLGLLTREPGTIPVVPNTTYVLSGEARSATPGARTCMRVIEWHTGADVATSDDSPSGVCASSTAWTAVQGTFTTKSTTNAVSIRLMGDASAGTFYWDNIGLMRSASGPIYVTGPPLPGDCPYPSSARPACLTSQWVADDSRIQFLPTPEYPPNTVNTNSELDHWAAIALDVQGGGSCASAAAGLLATRITNALDTSVYDQRQAGYVPYFQQWLAGGIVTHIYAAAKQIDYQNIPNALASLLASVRTQFGAIKIPQDPGCGLDSFTTSGGGVMNSCMDDHSLTASGFAWLAAFEYQKLRTPEPYLSTALTEVSNALAPMSLRASSTRGGGPCVESLTAGVPNCNGTVSNYTPDGYRVIGADHNQENPNYGIGLMSGIASACKAIFMASGSCGTFRGWNAIAAVALLHTAQQRASLDGSDWDQSGCGFFGSAAPCDDHTHLERPPNQSYKPRAFSLALFYGDVGLSGLGYPAANAYGFDSYCEPNTSWAAPYTSTFFGPNRYRFYFSYPVQLYERDTQAPHIRVATPANGATVSGRVTFTPHASDDIGVVSVEYYANGSPLRSSTCASPTTWPFTCEIDTSLGAYDGTNTIVADAWDAAGNKGVSSGITITISNPH